MLLIRHQRLYELSNIFGVFLLMAKFEQNQANFICQKSENGTRSKIDCINYRRANDLKVTYNPPCKIQDFPTNFLVRKLPANGLFLQIFGRITATKLTCRCGLFLALETSLIECIFINTNYDCQKSEIGATSKIDCISYTRRQMN